MRSLCCMLLLLAALAVSACNRNVAPYVEGEEPRPPDLSHIFPDESERDLPPQAAQQAAAPSAMPTAARSAPSGGGGGQSIHGTISITPKLAGDVKPGSVLFLVARPKGVSAGPPLAVLRISEPKFPLDFEIGPDNVMIQGMQFAGEISLSARLDGDGNAMTRGAGDLTGESAGAVAPGATGVQIVLDSRI